jgi:hypothetical protein
MYNALATALSANGYSLVDTQVISTRTWKVWKNPAANNSSGNDWYLAISYSTTGWAGLNIRPFESYDTVNHLGIRGIYNSAAFIPEGTYYTKYGATGYALETNWMGATQYQLITQAASYGYYLSVTPEAITGFTSASPYPFYVGLLALSTGAANAQGTSAFPLVCSAGGTTAVYQTRWPKSSTGTANASNSSFNTNRYGNGPQYPGGHMEVQTAEWNPVDVLPTSVGTTNLSPIRGVCKNLGVINVDATVGRGDTVSDGTYTYTLNGQSTAGACYAVKQV